MRISNFVAIFDSLGPCAVEHSAGQIITLCMYIYGDALDNAVVRDVWF